MSCLRTQCSAPCEALTCKPLISSLALYHAPQKIRKKRKRIRSNCSKRFVFFVVKPSMEVAAMKSVSRYKKSASSTNVWLFDFCLIASLLFRCIAIALYHAPQKIRKKRKRIRSDLTQTVLKASILNYKRNLTLFTCFKLVNNRL